MHQSTKIVLIFILFLVLVGVVFSRYLFLAVTDRNLDIVRIKEREKAKRGSIITSDGYHVAYTTKSYTATVDTRDIPKDSEKIFAKMFSIYSNLSQEEVLEKIRERKGNVILDRDLNFAQYQDLEKLARELQASKIMHGRRLKDGSYHYVGLDVYENGAERNYPYGDSLTPLIGFTDNIYEGRYTRVIGKKGIEKEFEDYLKPLRDGYSEGFRDSRKYPILDGSIKREEAINGSDLYLTINLSIQKRVEMMLSKYQNDLRAKEIIAGVMESETGKLVAFATSNRFVRKTLKDVSYLNIGGTEYIFEPGSVMKPIIFSLLLDKKQIWKGQLIDCENGSYRIGRNKITDEHRMKLVPVEEVIIHSSNIGMAKLVKDFDPISYYQGLVKFGFGELSGLEVTRELTGQIYDVQKLKRHIYRATTSYGYGLTTNFMQILKAYNVFNNDGKIVIPKSVAYLKTGDEIFSDIQRKTTTNDNEEIISVATSRKMKSILIQTVKDGSGKGADIIGLEIGGKTGTAHIAENGSYVDKYHSSFFGFANDSSKKYTIGVTVVDPQETYFASKIAVPIFKAIVDILVEDKYLQKSY
jgi:cell division protein FtsI (penicillin-binding protein 3)